MTLDEAESAPFVAPADLPALVAAHHPAMTRIAAAHGVAPDDAERAIVEAWRGALAARPRADELPALLFRALLLEVAKVERARSHWEASGEPAVESASFEGDDSRWAGWFRDGPPSLQELPNADAAAAAAGALARLPLGERAVVVLRDVAGWPAEDVSETLGISRDVQLALLHSGRAAVRRELERLAEARRA